MKLTIWNLIDESLDNILRFGGLMLLTIIIQPRDTSLNGRTDIITTTEVG